MITDTCIEYAAVVLSLLYVILASKENKWCWLAGGIGSALYVYLNAKQQLFYDAVLQSYYVFVALFALITWNRKNEKAISITHINSKLLGLLLLGGLVMSLFMGGVSYGYFKQTTSWLDAGVTAFSFIATWMTARKYIESWLLWVVIDLIAAVMYFMKGMQPTVVLYIAFTIVAVYGYLEWKKQTKGRLA